MHILRLMCTLTAKSFLKVKFYFVLFILCDTVVVSSEISLSGSLVLVVAGYAEQGKVKEKSSHKVLIHSLTIPFVKGTLIMQSHNNSPIVMDFFAMCCRLRMKCCMVTCLVGI